MNNTIIFMLAVLDYIAELIHLTYGLGALTRKVVVPTIAFTIVVCDIVWEYATAEYYTLRVYNTPLTTGLCAT